jgi:hypothetical protein
MKIKFLIVLLLSSVSLMKVYGQKYDSSKFSYINFYFNTQIAVPHKEFREAIQNDLGNLGYGIATGLVLSPLLENKPSPVLLGLDFGYFKYGQDKQSATSTSPPLKTTYNVFTWNGMARLRPRFQRGAITPFADGLLGLKLYNTKTKIDKDVVDFIFNDSQPEIINNVKNTSLNYGLGVGFYTNPKNQNNPGFTLRVLYLWGDDVTYVVRNSVKVTPAGDVTFTTDRANTSMVLIQLGFTATALKTLITSAD